MYKKSAHTRDQIEPGIRWKINGITSCAKGSYHNSENFSTLWSLSVMIFLNYDNFGVGEVVSEVEHRGMTWFKHWFFVLFLGTQPNFIIFWENSSHTWGQLELSIGWKIDGISNWARGGRGRKGMWWGAQRAEISWIMITLVWVVWVGQSAKGPFGFKSIAILAQVRRHFGSSPEPFWVKSVAILVQVRNCFGSSP